MMPQPNNSKEWLHEAGEMLPDGLHSRIMTQLREMEIKRRRQRILKAVPIAAAFVFIVLGCFAMLDFNGGMLDAPTAENAAGTDKEVGAAGGANGVVFDTAYGTEQSKSESILADGTGDKAFASSSDDAVLETVPELAVTTQSSTSAVYLVVLDELVSEYGDELYAVFSGEYYEEFDDSLIEENSAYRVYELSPEFYARNSAISEPLCLNSSGNKIIVIKEGVAVQ